MEQISKGFVDVIVESGNGIKKNIQEEENKKLIQVPDISDSIKNNKMLTKSY